MTEGAIFLNSGPLFSGDRLMTLEDMPEWESQHEAASSAFERIKESFEKHSTLLAGNPSVEETRFYMINPVLHALNFTHSVHELVSLGNEQATRVDYVCFSGANDFYEAEPARGGVAFFRPSLALVKAAAWGSGFDGQAPVSAEAPEGEEEESGSDMLPAQELDVLLRTTGVDYGVLTNGCDWRLYHRGTSSLVTTFFQADMIAAMKTDFDDFKRFFLLFNRDALVRDDTGTSFVDRMLQ
jgi:hypothetical protein